MSAEEQTFEFKELPADFQFGSGGSGDYVDAPVGEPLKAHVSKIETTETTDIFKTRPDGTPNPNYGKPVEQLVFHFKLDETDAAGQTYQKWVKNNVGEKSNLGRISTALFGSYGAIGAKTRDEIIGTPLRVTLKKSEKNPDRLVVDVEKLFAATEDQKQQQVVEEILPGTVVTASESKLDEVFGKSETKE